MLKDDPNWAANLARDAKIAELSARDAERERQIAELQNPFSSGFIEMDRRANGAKPPHIPASVIGPEHRHSEGEFAGRVCYCGEPDAPVPAGATRELGRSASSASA